MNTGTISALSNTTAAAAGAAAGQTSAGEQEDRFLRLLVTQMRNQDPLNPLDNAQVTSQMAQISTVTGVDKLNGAIEKLAQSMLSSQALQSAALIGRDVLATGSALQLGANGAAGGLELGQPADRVQVTIATPGGAVVRRLELGAQGAGTVNFQWDGLTDAGAAAPKGSYVFQAAATSGSQSISAVTLTSGRVTGISLGGGSPSLNLEGGTDLPVSSVLRIL